MTPATKALERKLASIIEGDVRFDIGSLSVYSTDASNYRQVPIGIVAPRNRGDIEAALSLARENAIPILARGGGTSLGGQCTNTALVLDFSKYMNRVLAIDPASHTAVVEPGVVQSDLNSALWPHGLFFAPDPSTKDRCTIGGMIGNNSCGAHSAAYGKTADNLQSLEAMLYDGTTLSLGANANLPDKSIVTAARKRSEREGELAAALLALRDRVGDEVRDHFPHIPRRVSGYNLDDLLPERGFNLARAMVGSEGTLGITLKASLRVVPRPKSVAVIVLGFDDVFVAGDQMPWMLAHRPEALEGFDHKLPDIAREKKMPGVRFLPAGSAFLVTELGGSNPAEARARAEQMLAEARRLPRCTGAALLTDEREQDAVWKIRESGLGSSAYIAGRPRTWPGAEDAAVPPARLGDYLRRFDAMVQRHALTVATYYGHFGEGCVHARISFDFTTERGIATFRSAMRELGDIVAEFGGSISGEHGDGIARSELLPVIYPRKIIDAFADFKRAFDPDSRMNPGVLVNPHPIDSHLKIAAAFAGTRRPREISTHFDFSDEGGLAGAALKCVGIGKCRKTDAGVMCPSYMATRDEKHSTRGRARILFDGLTTDLLPRGFTDDAVKEALDLCLACKGCKKECPSSVDMAAYRAEFFSHYYQEHRRPPAALFFGRLHEIARAAAFAPRIANAITHTPAAGALARLALGFAAARALPRFAPETFRSWFARNTRKNPPSDARRVILFPDTFTNHFEPEVAIAATRVLERAGFRVTIPARDLCCGRPLYDQGMLDRARHLLSSAMDALAQEADAGIPIIGLEPSCILTFRDELPALFPRDHRATALGARAMLLDEFLAREASSFDPPAIAGRAILHGHCHQKSIAGIETETAILARCRGLKLDVLDAGCCGMAGGFGYSADHYAVSIAAGERVLGPAIRAAGTNTTVIADGFSCRTQIRHLCPGVEPLHLAQVLDSALATPR